MALYSYKGLNAKGEPANGVIEAENEKEVIRRLRDRSIFVLKVREGVQGAGGNQIVATVLTIISFLHPRQFMPVRAGDLIIFFRQTALMLRAGYTLVASLEANSSMVSKGRLRRCINRMSDDIRRGSNFSSVLGAEKKIFSPMIANLIASGEQSGNLDTILERLAEGMERTKDLKRQLVAALVYPAFVLLASLGVVVFLVVGVIPRFAKFLTARNAELPGSTQVLMDISAFALDYGLYLGIGIGGTLFFILAAYTFKGGKRVIDRALLYLPVIGSAILFSCMAQGGWSLAMLLTSGVTALESLRITSGVIGNLAVSDCFAGAADRLLEGKSLSKAFEQPYITQMMRHMAAVGESSGQLDGVMEGVGEYYQKELSAKVKLISVMVEPMLILMVGGMVGFVYYAFFQAVMSVSKGGM